MVVATRPNLNLNQQHQMVLRKDTQKAALLLPVALHILQETRIQTGLQSQLHVPGIVIDAGMDL